MNMSIVDVLTLLSKQKDRNLWLINMTNKNTWWKHWCKISYLLLFPLYSMNNYVLCCISFPVRLQKADMATLQAHWLTATCSYIYIATALLSLEYMDYQCIRTWHFAEVIKKKKFFDMSHMKYNAKHAY